jgi:hypothetical protein
MWNGGNPYDYFSQNHRPEGILALSAGLLMLSATMTYRLIRGVWRVGK